MALEPGAPYPPQFFFFCQHHGVGGWTSEVNHGAPLAMRAVQSRRPVCAFHPFRKAKHTSHIVLVGRAAGSQQTKNTYEAICSFCTCFSFSAFPMDFLFTPHMAAVAERLNTTIAEFAFIIGEGLTLMFFLSMAWVTK
ncbi:uncharacterized protein TM35_000251600 [Trypanosoma theileri]|uniref:Uncharacterized protein n=1 Tax=Trypanosoma theileri TaxID=67003 RepID=A0A1X0NQ91_9TRYP|nr:uncharacterized protein TM35_000251600 [Trypanosoma theileri]ORC86864.1 hypothetical protein TM35_000251600 [Trypanosoma theileri]